MEAERRANGRPLQYPDGDYNLGGRSRYRAKVARMVSFLGGHCSSCGMSNDEHWHTFGTDLEIDHIDPASKEFNPKAYWAYNFERTIMVELLKCQALCGPCHLEKTISDRKAEDVRAYEPSF